MNKTKRLILFILTVLCIILPLMVLLGYVEFIILSSIISESILGSFVGITTAAIAVISILFTAVWLDVY